MCILALAWNAHPRWRLVVAANRDEFHARAAAPLARWADGMIAGRDLVAGGTWLAVHEGRRFAALTNLRTGAAPDRARLSRGALVAGLARGEEPAGLERYNPCNAVVVDASGARFLTNRPEPRVAALPPGLHAMSNGPLDPPWRKSLALTAAIRGWLEDEGGEAEPLLAALRDEAVVAEAGAEPGTVFVRDAVYGTRCSTVVLVDADGAGEVVERRFDAEAQVMGETRVSFTWRSA